MPMEHVPRDAAAGEEVDSLLDHTDAMTIVGDMDEDDSQLNVSKQEARQNRAQV